MSRAERYAEHLASDLVEAGRKVVSGRVTIKRHLRTIVSESGWKSRGPKNVLVIGDALAGAGVYPDIDITDMRIAPGSWVQLSDTPFAPRTVSRPMATEEFLNDYLAAHYESAFSNLDGLRHLQLDRPEKPLSFRGQKMKVDLVFRDADGTIVGVELERNKPKQDSAFQLRGYLDALKADAGGGPVRGVLITTRPKSAYLEELVLAALEAIPHPTEWYWYDTSITLERLDK